MKKVLLLNPPIYDFSAYDFWLRPYGLLEVGGMLGKRCELFLFDYMDRAAGAGDGKEDKWGRGTFRKEKVERPEVLEDIPRFYSRFGRSRNEFREYLKEVGGFDYVLVGTVMTYWYLGIVEAIEDVREFCGEAKIILGGVYASICSEHAKSLGADLVIDGMDMSGLLEYMGIERDVNGGAWWEGYEKLDNGAIKITDGCPFKCTYCSVPKFYSKFAARDMKRCLGEFEAMVSRGARNVGFYDDALLYKADEILVPFLKEAKKVSSEVNFHTPNALNARFITEELAESLVRYGFKTFYIGFESSSVDWQRKTGGKVSCGEFESAVDNLVKAGAEKREICAYQIFGHPSGNIEQAEASMRFVNGLGVRVMLADFSPIPGTIDGDACGGWVDMSEPLNHNKTAFTIRRFGFEQVNRVKDLCRSLNSNIGDG